MKNREQPVGFDLSFPEPVELLAASFAPHSQADADQSGRQQKQ
jgi:hypothetical protein